MNSLKNIILILFIAIFNNIIAQKTIEIETFNCAENSIGMSNIQKLNYKIISEHKVITDTTEHYFELKIKTKSDTLKVQYQNDYNQKVDTTYILSRNMQKIYICIDKFKDYKIKTLNEDAMKNKKWELYINSMHCFGFDKSKLIIKFKKNKIIAKYYFSKWIEKSEQKKEFIKKKILTEKQISNLILFEKKLRLMNRPNGDCTTSVFYLLKTNNGKISISDSSCSSFNEYDLLEKLGFEMD